MIAEPAREFAYTFLISWGLAVILITVAFTILPDHCGFFSDNIPHPLACDGVDFTSPRPCGICYDKRTATIATIFMGLGILLLFLPVLLHIIRKRIISANSPETLFEGSHHDDQ